MNIQLLKQTCLSAAPLLLIGLLGHASSAAATNATSDRTLLSAQGCDIAKLKDTVTKFSGEQTTTLEAVRWFAGGVSDDGKPVTPNNPMLPAHCIVTGVIAVHVGAPDNTQYGNHFRLRIPLYWNERFLFQGGGGNNGVVGDAVGTLKDGQNALAQGYAILTQDSGHNGRGTSFLLDRKAYIDFAFQSVHDATLIGKSILKAYTKKAPDYSYFMACSNGGREAMVSAQRYDDFDGVVAGDPGMSVMDQWTQNLAALQVVSKLAGTPAGVAATDTTKAFSDAQLGMVAEYFMNKCDRLDGLVDGIMSNYQACKANAEDEQQLRCAQDGGKSSDARCLSTAQAQGMTRIYKDFLPGGVEASMRDFYLGKTGSSFPLGSGYNGVMPNLYFMGYGFRGYPGVTGPADQMSSYPATPMEYVARFDLNTEPGKFAQGRLDMHGNNVDPKQPGPNFEAFKKRGGKMLIYTGSADPAVPVTSVIDFMDRFNAHFGAATAGKVARLFIVPGMNHCRGGVTTDQFDQLAPLVAWVEQGIAPEQIIARPTTGNALEQKTPGMNRPLCAYPKYAKYNGSGDPASANSFICTAP